jgi:AcrR family transcriptional regulator
MPENGEQQESIQQDMQQGSEQLEKQKNQKAAEKQRSAGKKMEQMATQMEQMQMQMQSESMEEDLDALRALLENILTLSFDEEKVMEALRNTAPNDPRYLQHGQTQRRLKDDARMVEDSLFALSKRIPQLSSSVNREIGLINRHMERALTGFSDRLTDQIVLDQQYVMTSFNNLALMLDEALKQMQQAMAQSQPGSGNCQKPGGNGSPSPSPSAGEIKRMQQALGAQLEKMKNQLGQGSNGGQTPEQKRQLSKEWAQLAAQQSALRRAAEKKASELSEDGSGMGEKMREIAREMEALERDLVNKNVQPATLRRQQDLMVRLLEAENAERTRGQDDKRKSTSGDPNLRMRSGMMEQYLRQKERESELLRTIPPELVPYYRDRVNEYFNNLDGDDR